MRTTKSLIEMLAITASFVIQSQAQSPPVITVQPQSQTVPPSGTVTLNVTATGTGPLSYQWQLNGTNLSNGTYGIITTAAGGGSGGDGGAATNASLNQPTGVAVAAGNLFIADLSNGRIREVGTNGLIKTVAGGGPGGGADGLGDGGAATNASLNQPTHVVVDASGNLFIGDHLNSRIREMNTSGIITTVAGGGSGGDGGQATNSSLNYPYDVAVDNSGNLFIADCFNNRIREVGTNGIITTVAGGGAGGLGDGGPAVNASLNIPRGVALDNLGDLFIADSGNNRIRKVAPDGIIATIAGNVAVGYSGDGGPGIKASPSRPNGLAVDVGGNVYVADTGNSVIRILRPVTEPLHRRGNRP